MDRFVTNILLVTANVGSLFEDPENLFSKWFDQFEITVNDKKPEFIAIHCQEVGGKNYEESMQYVNQFIKTLLSLTALQEYDKAKIYLDEDFTAEDKFTALGNLYFIHSSLVDISIWNFQNSAFTPVTGREVFSGSIENEPTKEKAKFPIDFFPEARWSRKGFMRTRWQINQVQFDLVNIHLFHDSSNLVSAEKSPSLYSDFRFRALKWTFQRFEKDGLEKLPFFIFGDFNFRLDTHQILKKLSETANVEHVRNKKDELSKVILQNQSNQPILTVGKKSFDHHEHHDRFFLNNDTLREYDIELSKFVDHIQEFDISFPPSYPFSEEVENGLSYMRTRCPSWCDRILYSHSAKDILVLDRGHPLHYNIIGRDVCMGDHKPVYLHIHIKARPGMCQKFFNSSSSSNVTPLSVGVLPCTADGLSTTSPLHVSADAASVVTNSPGYADDVSSAPAACTPISVSKGHADPSTPIPHATHSRSHSIVVNGEVREAEQQEPWNIFDYAVFEDEDALEPRFRFSYKHRNYIHRATSGNAEHETTGGRFSELARDVIRAESVIMAFQGSRRIRKMSESSDSSEASEDLSPSKIGPEETREQALDDGVRESSRSVAPAEGVWNSQTDTIIKDTEQPSASSATVSSCCPL